MTIEESRAVFMQQVDLTRYMTAGHVYRAEGLFGDNEACVEYLAGENQHYRLLNLLTELKTELVKPDAALTPVKRNTARDNMIFPDHLQPAVNVVIAELRKCNTLGLVTLGRIEGLKSLPASECKSQHQVDNERAFIQKLEWVSNALLRLPKQLETALYWRVMEAAQCDLFRYDQPHRPLSLLNETMPWMDDGEHEYRAEPVKFTKRGETTTVRFSESELTWMAQMSITMVKAYQQQPWVKAYPSSKKLTHELVAVRANVELQFDWYQPDSPMATWAAHFPRLAQDEPLNLSDFIAAYKQYKRERYYVQRYTAELLVLGWLEYALLRPYTNGDLFSKNSA